VDQREKQEHRENCFMRNFIIYTLLGLMNTRSMRWVEHVVCMGREMHTELSEIMNGRDCLGEFGVDRGGGGDNIKMGFKDVDWIHLACDRVQ
jgi:hypothetical protein